MLNLNLVILLKNKVNNKVKNEVKNKVKNNYHFNSSNHLNEL